MCNVALNPTNTSSICNATICASTFIVARKAHSEMDALCMKVKIWVSLGAQQLQPLKKWWKYWMERVGCNLRLRNERKRCFLKQCLHVRVSSYVSYKGCLVWATSDPRIASTTCSDWLEDSSNTPCGACLVLCCDFVFLIKFFCRCAYARMRGYHVWWFTTTSLAHLWRERMTKVETILHKASNNENRTHALPDVGWHSTNKTTHTISPTQTQSRL